MCGDASGLASKITWRATPHEGPYTPEYVEKLSGVPAAQLHLKLMCGGASGLTFTVTWRAAPREGQADMR